MVYPYSGNADCVQFARIGAFWIYNDPSFYARGTGAFECAGWSVGNGKFLRVSCFGAGCRRSRLAIQSAARDSNFAFYRRDDYGADRHGAGHDFRSHLADIDRHGERRLFCADNGHSCGVVCKKAPRHGNRTGCRRIKHWIDSDRSSCSLPSEGHR